jgi:sulfatase modifying factor 1
MRISPIFGRVLLIPLLISTHSLAQHSSSSSTSFGSNASQFTMNFVNIGYANNDGDFQLMKDGSRGYGAVNYEYKIGQYEVTSDQWNAVAAEASNLERLAGVKPWSGSQPAGSVGWYEAVRFCNWMTSGDVLKGAYQHSYKGYEGLFANDGYWFSGIDRDSALATYDTIYVLPTEDEWHKAAYYDPATNTYFKYPTGNVTPDGIDFIGDSNFDSAYRDEANNQQPLTVGSGSLENNGTYDMGGNILEWNENKPQINGGEGQRSVRGGHWVSDITSLESSTRSSEFEQYGYHGFRVVSITLIPEPSSTALLGLGGLALMLRRRR